MDLVERRSLLTPEKQALLERRLRGEAAAHPLIPRRTAGAPARLSSAQRRLWFLDQLEPGAPTYNVPGIVHLEGALDPAALAAGLSEVVRRHEVLRSVFREARGEPVQEVMPAAPVPLPVVDLRALPAGERRAEAARLAADEARRGFDLAAGPLLRARLLRLAGREHRLLLTLHHIVADGWSAGLLVDELAALYAGGAAGHATALPELPIQYADYAEWQRAELDGGELEPVLAAWKERLAGAPHTLELPADRPRPAARSLAGGRRTVALGAELTQAVRALALAEGTTPFAVLVTACEVLLGRLSGQTDLLLGVPLANRARPEVQRLIGFFVNTVVLRADLAGESTFRQLLARTRGQLLEAFAHQGVPFERLVEELRPERSLAHAPLIQAVFALQNAAQGGAALPGLAVRREEIDSGTAKFDLTFDLADGPEIRGGLEYSTDLFDAATAERFAVRFVHLVAGAVAEPGRWIGELPLLPAWERHQLLHAWNDTASAYPADRTVHGLFAEVAAAFPGEVAVEQEGRTLTYAELDAAAGRLACRLRALGVGPGVRVAVCARRSPETITALLAVLKAGGAYVPLDPAYPRHRQELMLAAAGVWVLLREEGLGEGLAAPHVLPLGAAAGNGPGELCDAPDSAGPDDLAYVLFTSGSTGEPKAVAVPHRAVVRLVRETGFARFGPEQVFLQLAPLSFDASTLEIWGALLHGGRLVVMPPAVPTLAELARAIERHRVSVLWLTAGLFHQMVDAHLDSLAGVGQLLAGGDVLSPPHVRRVLAAASGTVLINGYGPTENTTFSCCQPLRPGEPVAASVPIGRPIANSRAYLLDGGLEPAAIGTAGEVYVAGAGLARGYLGSPALTAERFVPDPFAAEPGARLYRTGDRARFLSDGRIDFLGRIDRQIKIRGFRVETGEVEAALAEHPAVRSAAVVALPHPDGAGEGSAAKRLAAYLVPTNGDLEIPAVRAFLRERLPEHLIPSAFVQLPALPVTANGKVDRAALPAPEAALPERPHGQPVVAPSGLAEELLAALWADLLGLDRVGAEDDFFELGGHSLLATRLISGVRENFGVELPLRAVFEAPTVAALARRITAAEREAAASLPPLARRGLAEAPLSFSQERLWFLDQFEPASAAYNLPSLLRLSGRLDSAAFAAALAEVARRHESLRTSFREAPEGPRQVIAPAVVIPLPLADLRSLPEAVRDGELRRQAAALALPFDLGAAPLVRALLLRLGEEEHAFLLDMHHIVSDGWSIQVVVREMAALYAAFAAGQASPLPPLPVQYADYALWQRQVFTGERLESQLAYWRERLAGAPPLLDLPTDRRRPAVQTYRGAHATLDLDAGLTAGLKSAAARGGATLFMTLLAGFQVLLARWSGERDVLVGTPVAGRTHADVEGLIGFFLNSLVLRTDLAGEPAFPDLLARVREAALGAYAHQDLPFEKLLEALQPQRDLSRTPLFQVFVNMLNFPESRLQLPGLALEVLTLPEVPAKFDLTLYLAERAGGVHVDLVYNADLFDPARAVELLAQLRQLLAAVALDPAAPVWELPLVTPEAACLLPDPAAPLDPSWFGSVAERFERQADRAPDALAASDRDERWTYRQLDEQANRLAQALLAAGVERGDVVALWAHRSATLVWALLGVLKAGAAFVVLDPAYPAPRSAACLRLARPRAFLRLDAAGPLPEEIVEALRELPLGTRLDLAPRAATGRGEDGAAGDPLARFPAERPGVRVGPDDLAYVAFTSGSTGVPKGILGRQGPLTHFLPFLERTFGFGPEDRFSLVSGLSHDPLHRDVFTPLQVGAAVIVPEPGQIASPGWLAGWMARERVTVAHLTPAMGQLLTEPGPDGPTDIPALRWAFFVGDVLTRGDVARLEALAPAVTVVNFYGSTETQRAVGYRVVRRGGRAVDGEQITEREVLPLGRGMDDVQLLVQNAAGRLAGIGEVGEICVRSPHLAAGYLGLPELSAERFVANPATGDPGDRLYRTGDLGRYLPDGTVVFAGRADQQVKIRGFRIELGEIEAVLASHPAVLEAAVLAAADPRGERRLAAYAVPRPGTAPTPAELRSFLAARLPDYMVPAAFNALADLPVTPNGKLDRRALPAPVWGQTAGDSYVPPRNPVEEALAEIWAEVLGVERVGVHDGFFELGGHSLLATQVVSRVRDTLGLDLPLRSLFAHPTIAALAEELAGHDRAERLPLLPVPRTGELPLSFAQERLWFLDQLQPGSAVYNIPAAVRLRGRLDVPALAAALAAVAARHESLRTTFHAEAGRPVQTVHPRVEIPLPVVDLAGLPAGACAGRVEEIAAAAFRRPFDLSRAPLLRALLARTADGEHALVLVFHHIVIDGWSLAVFVGDLAALYESCRGGAAAALPPLPVQYADFAHWQRQWIQGEVLTDQLAYWKTQLGGPAGGRPPLLELPTDRPRPALPRYAGARLPLALGAELTAALKKLSAGRRLTLFMTLLAAFDALLARTTEQRDLVVGTPIANRTRREIEGLVGMFFNLLALRARLAGGATFEDLLEQVRETALGAYAHQDLPFERLLEELQPERQMNRTPLFQVTFVLQNAPLRPIALAELDLEPFQIESGIANFDINLQLSDSPQGLVGALEYHTDLFDAATIRRFGEHFRALLEAAAAVPGTRLLELPMLAPFERAQLVHEWNDTAAPYDRAATIHRLFEEQAARTPGAVAVVAASGEAWTYDEVERHANRLAHQLIALGARPGVRIGIALSRGPEMIPALLAVLKSGAAYVPLSLGAPDSRLAWILAALRIPAVLTQGRHAPRLAGLDGAPALEHLLCLDRCEGVPALLEGRCIWLPADLAGQPETAPEPRAQADDEAYIIFTSGSTGTPKGVLVRHQPVINLIEWANPTFGIGPGDRVLFLTSLSFDLSVYDVFGLLAAGGSIRVADESETGNPEALVEALATEPVTFWDSAPAALQQLVPFLPKEPIAESRLRLVFLSGDWIPLALPDQIRTAFPGAAITSLGGATEATVWSNVFPVGEIARHWVSIPYGRPIPNARYHVLDAVLEPCPIGVPGDLYIGGECLSSGYVGEPALTALKYRPDPFGPPGAFLYWTGDRARFWHDGTIEFLGRLDHQVKIRGYRIELGEIETVLGKHPGVLDAVVLAREDTPGDKRLVAYVVPDPDWDDAPEKRRREQVAHVEMVYDATYGGSTTADATFDVSGWISSYTGLPIPAEEMQEWVDQTVGRIAGLAPRRVLEVGCGTGLLLFRLAPAAELYWGTDLSRVSLGRIERELPGRGLPQVRLLHQPADHWSGIAPRAFDGVVINSVTQHFPGAAYLLEVLAGAVEAVADGGFVFVGDVRSLPHLAAFHTSLQLHRAPGSLGPEELGRRVAERVAHEEELVIDPALFLRLAERLPRVRHVEVQLQRGRHHNEVTRFRYSAVIHVGAAGVEEDGIQPACRDWQADGLSLLALRRLLGEEAEGLPEVLIVRGIPNARLAREARALAWQRGTAGPATLDDLRAELAGSPPDAVDPEDVWDLGRDLPWSVRILWPVAGPLDCFDAVFVRAGASDAAAAVAYGQLLREATARPWAELANNPSLAALAGRLTGELRRHVAGHLPEYMVPSAILLLDALPVTGNGKLDRRALPAPDAVHAHGGGTFVAPRTPVETLIGEIWAQVLGVERVGAEDHFFDLGGHSLLATRVVSRLREAFQAELSLSVLFEAPTVAALARVIEAGRPQETGPGPALHRVIRQVRRGAPLPPSFGQQRLWFIDQLAPGSPLYHIPVAVRLEGALDRSALQSSLAEIVRRHEALRTTFREVDGVPHQVIHDTVDCAVRAVDLRALPPAARRPHADRLAQEEARRPFDLAAGPLVRAVLLHLDEADRILLVTLHHVISDGWSIGVLVREIAALYAAFHAGKGSEAAGLPPLPVQYADFAAWQREWLQGETLDAQLGYWRERLAGASPVLQLPTDHPRPALQSFRGSRQLFHLPRPLADALEGLGRGENATLFMILLAAFQTLLHRYTGQGEVSVGSPIANRTRPEVEPLIGFFVNTLVLRSRLDGRGSFRRLLGEVREAALGAYAHQDLPFEKLIEELQPDRDVSYPPLFQVMFTLQNEQLPQVELADLRLSLLSMDARTANFDLALLVVDAGDGLPGTLTYNTDLFERATVVRMIGHLTNVLAAAAADPGRPLWELPLLSAAERNEMLVEWNEPRPAYSAEGCVHRLIEAQARRRPDDPAVIGAGGELSYGELDRRADRLARRLQGLGVGPEVLVGLAAERSADLVVGLLAVLKAGGAFVPLDPELPRERLALLLQDTRLKALVTQPHLLDRLPEVDAEVVLLGEGEAPGSAPDGPVESGVDPDHLAYVLHTSGSTGTPKGVMIPHRGLYNRISCAGAAGHAGPSDRFLFKASIGFDVSLLEILIPLAVGGCTVIARPGGQGDPTYLVRLMAEHGVTQAVFAPSLLRAVLDEPEIAACTSLRSVASSAEALPLDLQERFFSRLAADLNNRYGPTETSIAVTSWTCARGVRERTVPIGRPIAQAGLFVLDCELQPVPVGVPGQLHVGGVCLGRGYLERPDLTADGFRPHPWSRDPGARLYQTGDLVRYRRDGALEFLGRIDHQVKIRGVRIELGEVEAALEKHPAVREAAVVDREGPGGGKELAAYLVPRPGGTLDTAALRSFLQKRLPEPAVPSHLVVLEKLPLLPSGKLDRAALPSPREARPPAAALRIAPRTPTEELIAGVWREVLGVESVGARDNFFDLGGHSLLAIQVRAKLQQLLGREIPMVSFFHHPTISSFARYLDEEGAAAPRVVGRTALAAAGTAGGLSRGTEIAIIGMAGRFPGARDVDQFWRNLRQGVESISFFSDEELLASGVDPEWLNHPTYVRAAGVLEDIDLFDAGFFDVSPREAEATDPQHRMFLECAWEALERAGYDPAAYGRRIGVFAGTGLNTYLLRVRSQRDLLEAVGSYQALISNEKDFLPTRVSYKLGLRGPSLAVQTACSTSLVAVHVACQSLRDGESDMALAGGVSISVPQKAGYRYQEGMILSPDGHCRAFDARAGGTVRGNGVGLVVLKRLADALADGDHIHAVIKASAVNNDGAAKVGYTAPSVDGQAQVIADALSLAGVDPATISYLEAHGTGTRLGDPIEITALHQVFGALTTPGRCALGSVKTNVGHLNAAAGIAGLIKTALMIEHRELAPSLHFERPNPEIDFASGPFYVNTRLAPWPSDGTPRRAGVSSFGIGGTNAHLVLEEPPREESATPAGPERPAHLLLLSARSETALAAAAANLAGWLTAHPEAPLADVAATLQVGRRRFRHRLALVCRTAHEAAAALAALDPRHVATAAEDAAERPVAFLFPGQGSQHVGMALDLYRAEPSFRAELDRVADLFQARLGFDLRLLLAVQADDPEENGRRLAETAHAQAALFAVEYALARLWMRWGVQPQAMIGHSLGEYVAACLAGVFSLADAVAVVAARGRLLQQLPGGVMLAVPLAEEELAGLLDGDLALAAVNGPALCVVAGPEAEIAALEARLAERLAGTGREARRLHTSHAFHSPMVEPAVVPLAEVVRGVTLRPPQIPCLSNVTGSWLTAAEATDPAYWAAHLRRTVRFSQGLAELFRQPDLALLEVGPGRALTTLARRHPERPAAQPVVPSLPAPGEAASDLDAVLAALGRLWLAGAAVDWQGFHAGTRRRRVPLPTYPFERRRYWAEAPPPADGAPAPPILARPAGRAASARAAAQSERRPGITVPYVAPRTALERDIAGLWQRLLGVEAVGVHDDYFELGGSSLLIVQLRAKLEEATGVALPPHFLLQSPTVAAIAAEVEARQGAAPSAAAARAEAGPADPCLVELRRGERARPLFLVHPAGGHVYFYRDLAARLDSGRPVFGLRSLGLEEGEAPLSRIEEMAARYLAAVRSVQPAGPYLLGGSSMGGTIAYEMAQQLHAAGEQADLLALIDTPGRGQMPARLTDDAAILSYLAGPSFPADELRRMAPDEQLRHLLAAAREQGRAFPDLDLATARRLLDLFKEHMRALRRYVPVPYPGRIVFFRAGTRRPTDPRHPERPWIDLAAGGIEIHPVPGHHISMHQSPNVEVLIEQLRVHLARLGD